MNEPLTKDQKLKIVEALQSRKQNLVCPMCQHTKFTMPDGYFNNTMQTNLNGTYMGGPSIPTIAIICENCGFVSQHSLGILNLLSNDQNDSNG